MTHSIAELEKLIKGSTPGDWESLAPSGIVGSPIRAGVENIGVAIPRATSAETAANSKLFAASKSLAAELLEMKQRERWIPVAEKLPSRPGEYPVIVEFGTTRRMVVVEFLGEGWLSLRPGLIQCWLDVPAPPASDTKAKEI